jgi:type VI secretion system secreted protein VgrG
MANYTQSHRVLSAKTPLGDDVLLLASFTGREQISQLFQYQLDFLSVNKGVDPKAIVGKPITWSVHPVGGTARPFHGVVSRFSAGGVHARGFRHYRAEVVPWLWFLTRTANCRIFQNKSAPDIIRQIFDEFGFSDYEVALKGTYVKREYCVQYRETAFEFVSRLAEEEGIFYFFKHTAEKHALVLADQKSAYFDSPEKSVDFGLATGAARQITGWEHQYTFRSGKWAQTDYNFETPAASLLTNTTSVVKVGGNDKFEVFDYPGRYGKTGDGNPITKIRMEEEEAGFDTVVGQSTCSTFSPGGKFTLAKFPVDAEQKSYVVTSIRHMGVDESHTAGTAGKQMYSNEFTCIPDSVTFRPERVTPRPGVWGPQPAVVVGPKGEEIYTDKYGRVKVQFFWDRLGKKDENSSCWVRVSQNWAGKNWGIVCHPRIGQEVLVDFLEGDPDRPVIVGRVYNADQMPPYALPANQTQSVLKTRSSKNGTTENFNELRFEDKKGSEEIYFHAEKDFNRVVENNDTLKVGSNKAEDGSQTIEIWKDRTETVKTGNEKVTIEKGNRDIIVQTGNDTHKIQKGNRDVQIDMGNDTLTIKMGNQTTKLNLGKSETEAMQSIELKVGQSSVKVDQTGVKIKGMMITIDGTVQTQLKGLMTQVSASAIMQIQGGLMMIG